MSGKSTCREVPPRMNKIGLFLLSILLTTCTKKEDLTNSARQQIYTGWSCKLLQDYNGVQIPRVTANSVVEKCIEADGGKVIYENQSLNCLSWIVNQNFLDLTQISESSMNSNCVTVQGDEISLNHELGSGSFNNRALSCEEYTYTISQNCEYTGDVHFYRISGTKPSMTCHPEGKSSCVDFYYEPSNSELESICQGSPTSTEVTCDGPYGHTFNFWPISACIYTTAESNVFIEWISSSCDRVL